MKIKLLKYIVWIPWLALFVDGAFSQCHLDSLKVYQRDSRWWITSPNTRLVFDEKSLSLIVNRAIVNWSMYPPTQRDVLVEFGGNTTWLSLLDAEEKTIEAYQSGYKRGVKISLRGFHTMDEALDFSLTLFVCIETPNEEIVFTVVPREGVTKIKRLNWPAGFEEDDLDFTIVPFMQGMLLPSHWPKKVWLYTKLSYGRGLYMPWWGQQKGNSGYMAILETPADGGCNFEHPAGGPTKISPLWVHSLGSMSYARSVRYAFFDSCNYVTMAKHYRKYIQDRGSFVSLREKIARTPRLGNLIGSPVIHTSILYHIQPKSSYYHKDEPEKNDQLVTFAERARQLRALEQRGVVRAYVHLDGWGKRGYDNLHPDVLPPCPRAGGWQGLKHLADVCDSIGYVFALHDQYRDFYLDATSYDPRHTIINENGDRPLSSVWYGGEQSILCACLAPGYVRRNYAEIFDHQVKVRGAYLDVFAVVVPDECYNEEHPMSRRACMKSRAECFAFIRSFGGVVSSEEPVDWAVPYIDLVHHGPYALVPNPGGGPAMGIPIPLFSLVYHDALLLPWSLGRGAWGIPETDLGLLHALLNGGMPYLNIEPDQHELDRVKVVTDLHQKVALQEMVNHELLSNDFRRQRSEFSDGTVITVDLDTDEYWISCKKQK